MTGGNFPLRRKVGLVLLAVALWGLFSAGASLEYRSLYPIPASGVTQETWVIPDNARFERNIQECFFTTPDGVRLNALYVPPAFGSPTVLYAHGNGHVIWEALGVIKELSDAGYGVLMFDYRGYGKSGGTPSEQGLYTDLEAASHFLVKQFHTPVQQQIAWGASLGGGVVVEVATRLPFKAVVIHSTFTSTPEVGQHLMRRQASPWLAAVVPLVIHQRFASIEKISRIQSPLVIAHGDRDPMIPVEMAEQLYRKATAKYKTLLIEPGFGHMVTTHALISVLEGVLAKSRQS